MDLYRWELLCTIITTDYNNEENGMCQTYTGKPPDADSCNYQLSQPCQFPNTVLQPEGKKKMNKQMEISTMDNYHGATGMLEC